MKKLLTVIMCAALMGFVALGCGKPEPSQPARGRPPQVPRQAAPAVEETVDEVKETVQEVVDETQDAAEQVTDKLQGVPTTIPDMPKPPAIP